MSESAKTESSLTDYLRLLLLCDRQKVEAEFRLLLPPPNVIDRLSRGQVFDEPAEELNQFREADAALVCWPQGQLDQLTSLFQLLRRLRVPAFALCGSDPYEHVSALQNGADAVLVRPVILPLLYARLLAWRRLTNPQNGEKGSDAKRATPDQQVGDLRIDIAGHRAYAGDEALDLTGKEFDLLRFLMERAGQLCSRDDILDHVWGINFDTGTNMVDVYMHFVRSKLKPHGLDKMIQTVRGKGYRLTEIEPEKPTEE